MKFLLFVLAVSATFAQIVPTSRRPTWQGNVGISGGIPTGQTQYGSTLTPNGTDDQSQIQTALGAAASGQYVLLGPGNFKLPNNDLDWQSVGDGKVLRGSGTATTTITIATGATIYMRGNFYDPAGSGATRATLTGSTTKGDTTFTVDDASWVSVNDHVVISQLDDTSFVNRKDENNGDAASPWYNANRGFSALVKVTGKSTNTLTIDVPLGWAFTTGLTAQICKVQTSTRKNCGIEDFTVVCSSGSSDTKTIRLENAQGCWVKNVNVSNTKRVGIQLDYAYRCEVRHCTITGGALLGAGQGYGIALYNASSCNLFEDNIFINCHVGHEVGYGAFGNVIAYNFETLGAANSGQAPAAAAHGYHAWMNLYEGNFFNDKFLFDNTHGSGSHHTTIRNRVMGFNNNGLTYDTTAIHLMAWNRMSNLVGNILGKIGTHTAAQTWVPTSFDASNDKIVIRGGDDADGVRDVGDNLATSDPIITGNWDSVSQSVTWDGSGVQTIPDSYYLTGKPANFGILSWPVYTSSMGNAAANTDIPAGYRYVNGNDPPLSGSTGGTALSGKVILSGKVTAQ